MRSSADQQLDEFLRESNAIEGETSGYALADAHAAWRVAMKCQGDLTLEGVLAVHFALMYRVNTRIAGKLRKVKVWVGRNECPNPGSVRRMLMQWLETCKGREWTEETIQEAHVAFEKIHPFEDGNGRTGRILMNWMRLKAGLPLLIIHTGDEQMAYYQWFK